ncbi:hypothetical protein P0Y35_05190 [Kiritimatiellaeota bacterium B1221]|nr:hypothetical protein [Kiritimatiellaeota bacterium B1221]
MSGALQKISGGAALAEGMIYVIAFGYFGMVWRYPDQGAPAEQMSFLREHAWSFSLITFLMYIVFGCLLAVLVVGIYERLKGISTALMQVASLFGALWVGMVVASGMISNIGLASVLRTASVNPDAAAATWSTVRIVVEGLGGGNELIGGLWVLLLSVAALRGKEFQPALNGLGILVGLAGVSTVYPAEILTVAFGLSQLIWFCWLGWVLIRNPQLPV